MRLRLIFCVMVGIVFQLAAQQASWIWYPGDFEVWLHREVSNRRIEKGGAINPTFYRTDSPFHSITFAKKGILEADEEFEIKGDGRYSVQVNGRFEEGQPERVKIPKGKYQIYVKIVNLLTLPSIWVKGKTIFSDTTWTANNGTLYEQKIAQGTFTNKNLPPSTFHFPAREIAPVSSTPKEKSVLVDFGKETFGFVRLKNISAPGKVILYYGESPEEAVDGANCETYEFFDIPKDSVKSFTTPVSRAFRYINVVPNPAVNVKEISALYEYNPLTYKGKFKSSDPKLNKIWDVACYTLHLNTREFMLDGIKRDRWVWSGDAVQSFLMNYYLFFDQDVNKRTIIGLRGHEPAEVNLNKIVDYSFYWFISIYEYYQYTGDRNFVEFIYPKMLTLMSFCQTRLNKNNFIEGKDGDWTYVDWAEIDNGGEVALEQILYARALESLALCGKLAGDKNAAKFQELADQHKTKTIATFWDEKQNAMVHNRKDNVLQPKVTRYPNMFALMYGYFDKDKADKVKKDVLLNDKVQKITTPYMRFYELGALCEIGEHKYVMKEMLNYWGGMIEAGATTFWEAYDPNMKGTEHLAFYGRPYGKSLCHAWGASPIYLLGKYYLGVKPLTEGYKTFSVEPQLGGLDWIEGTVPTPQGEVKVYMTKTQIKVLATKGQGTLHFKSAKAPKLNIGTAVKTGDSTYEVALKENSKEYVIEYK